MGRVVEPHEIDDLHRRLLGPLRPHRQPAVYDDSWVGSMVPASTLTCLKSFHESAIDAILEPHHPSAFERPAPFGPQGAAIAQVEQGQEVGLRPVTL